jgi:hypothetical protein
LLGLLVGLGLLRRGLIAIVRGGLLGGFAVGLLGYRSDACADAGSEFGSDDCSAPPSSLVRPAC